MSEGPDFAEALARARKELLGARRPGREAGQPQPDQRAHAARGSIRVGRRVAQRTGLAREKKTKRARVLNRSRGTVPVVPVVGWTAGVAVPC